MPIQSNDNEVRFRMPGGEIVSLAALIQAEIKPARPSATWDEVRASMARDRAVLLATDGPGDAEKAAAIQTWLDANLEE